MVRVNTLFIQLDPIVKVMAGRQTRISHQGYDGTPFHLFSFFYFVLEQVTIERDQVITVGNLEEFSEIPVFPHRYDFPVSRSYNRRPPSRRNIQTVMEFTTTGERAFSPPIA